jgi:flotillin
MPGEEPVLVSVAALLCVSLLALWVLYLKCFIIVPPNRALIVFGKGAPRRQVAPPADGGFPGFPGSSGAPAPVHRAGLRIEVGGGVFVPPWSKDYAFLPLGVIDIDCGFRAVATADPHTPRVDAMVSAQVKVPADPEGLNTAAENLLGKSEEELKSMARSVVEGYVRGEFGRRTMAEIDHEREKIAAELQVLTGTDLVSIGLVVKSLVIKAVAQTPRAPGEDIPAAAAARSADVEGLVWQMSSRVRKLEARLDALEHGAVLVGKELKDLHVEMR